MAVATASSQTALFHAASARGIKISVYGSRNPITKTRLAVRRRLATAWRMAGAASRKAPGGTMSQNAFSSLRPRARAASRTPLEDAARALCVASAIRAAHNARSGAMA